MPTSGAGHADRANRLYTRSAIPCAGRWPTLLLLGLAVLPAACKTGLTARKDAGRFADANAGDASPDVGADVARGPDLAAGDSAPPDLAAADLARPDVPTVAGVPKGFRFVNHTERTAYVEVDFSVGCRVQSSAGFQDCFFFDLWCLFHCDKLPAGGNCCVQCEQPPPALWVIPPGGHHTVPWNGSLYAKVAGLCSTPECECQVETTAASGSYEASAKVFANYLCAPMAGSPCEETTDQGTIAAATPRGSATSVAVPFSIPYPDDEVVLDIWSLPAPDAGTTPDLVAPDLPAADLPARDLPGAGEPAADALPSAFVELPGNTFAIAAASTPPDASSGGDGVCRPMDSTARYDLVFSSDGTKVEIVRTDPVQEQIVAGTLTSRSDTRLVYNLNLFAGGELVVERVDGGFYARYTIYGSGRPVIGCIESPMEKR
jgi:hypothetical protein